MSFSRTLPVLPQPHRRAIDLSILSAEERAELCRYIERMRRAGDVSRIVMRRVLDGSEQDHFERLVSRVIWREESPQNATERGTDDVFGKRALSPSSPALGRVEDLIQAIAIKLGILVPDLQASDPYALEERLDLVAKALSRINYTLDRRQRAQ